MEVSKQVEVGTSATDIYKIDNNRVGFITNIEIYNSGANDSEITLYDEFTPYGESTPKQRNIKKVKVAAGAVVQFNRIKKKVMGKLVGIATNNPVQIDIDIRMS